MIKVYYRSSCSSTQRTFRWFEEHSIPIEKRRISKITSQELVKILSLTDLGLEDVLKRSSRHRSVYTNFMNGEAECSFRESVMFLQKNTDLLQTPIIVKENKLLIGFNNDEIRQFLPQEYRRQKKTFEL